MGNLSTVKVLLVDDDEDDFLLTSAHFRDIKSTNFDIEWKDSFEAATAAIANNQYDIFIFDYLLGAKTAFELIDVVKEHGRVEPIILLTGVGNAAIDFEAVEHGAYDYLVKSELNANLLERSVRYSLKQAETLKALMLSENKYRSVFEQANDVIFICSNDYRLLSISDSVYDLIGRSPDELMQHGDFNLVIDQDKEVTLKGLMESSGEVKNMPVEMREKSGETKPCLITCKVVTDLVGEFFVHGVIVDQTDRLKAERESLMSEKIQAAARLMRTLAHEVRNPLTNIHLAAENLDAEVDDAYLTVYVDIIKRNTTRIDTLITEVLNSARQTDIQFLRQSIEPIVERAISNITDRAALKGIQIKKELQTNGFEVMVDEIKFEIALNNILINAVEALDDAEEPTLLIATKIEHNHLVLKITDNGVGIEKDKIQHLFEPYFTSKNNGIGLGLSATLSIIQAHKASIDVSSTVGIGTTFIIQLPLFD